MNDYDEDRYCITCGRRLTRINTGEYGDECKICEKGEQITGGKL